MRVGIAWGRQNLELEVLDKNLVQPSRAPASPLSDPVRVLAAALEHPREYPALWRALTPEDHLAVVVDERVPRLPELLVVLLEHVRQAGVQPEAITLLCTPPSSGQPWLDDLPDDFQDMRIEVHQPGDRRKLAYLAATKQGRRVYLNRTAVDADQLVVLSRRGYDPRLGYCGAETSLYPAMGDEATIQEHAGKLERRAPSSHPWPIQQEASEVSWLLGAPFFVQIIEGSGDAIEKIVAGPLASAREAERLLNARWRVVVDDLVDVVVASVTGDPSRQTMDDLARASFAAARVVKPGGSIVLLSEVAPTLGPSFEKFRQNDDPILALSVLEQEKPADLSTAFMWATAASHAKIYLLSGLSAEVAEELYAVPMQNASQAQKLLTERATCLLLPDAHKTLAVLRGGSETRSEPEA